MHNLHIHTAIQKGYFCNHSALDCGPLGDPENGMVSVSTTTYKSVATYSCNTGYTLRGNVSQTCLDTGLWSDSQPYCTGEIYIIIVTYDILFIAIHVYYTC